jgi:trimethylamine--corrinoid protein Co-methyltransferase
MTEPDPIPAPASASRRRRGREARRSARTEKVIERLPPMERGIPYVDLVPHAQLLRIHDASMTMLEEIGIEFRDDEAISMWKTTGATVDGYRVRIDRELLMSLISTAPSE